VVDKRVSRRRALTASAGAAAGAAFLAACGGGDDGPAGPKDASGLLTQPADTTAKAKKGGILKRHGTGEGSLDPNLSVSGVSSYHEVGNARLFTLKVGHFSPPTEDIIEGDVAESWEYSPDRLQVTIKLRPNVKFHNLPPVNGRVLDVDDVIFSWNRFTTNSPSRAAVANSANPDAPVLSITAVDSRTVVMKLKEPLAYVLTYFVGRELVNMMPKEAANPSVLDLRKDLLGAGPFYLANHEPSVNFTFKRHQEFWDKNNVFVDQIDYPIITEYAQGMAQFRAGSVYLYPVRKEDIIQTKRDVPEINLYADQISGSGQNLLFGRRTPAFRDERVRLAFSLSYDRETWIDTLEDALRFEREGLPVERSWFSAFPGIGQTLAGWRPEPRDEKEFGPNAKYYQHDVAEARRLLAAAGYPDGFEVVSTSPISGAGSGITTIEARQQMNGEAGLRFKNNLVPYETEFIPKYRDAQADFEGIAYKAGVTLSNDPIDRLAQCYWSKGGVQFYGFDASGRGDASGDPYVDQQIVKARLETDTPKRKAIFQDLQRHLAAKAYGLHGLGGSTNFTLAWPIIGNYMVWQGAPGGGSGTSTRVQSTRWWLDDAQPPLKRA
jgi:peptide/nickel transport system substrate-binding protein